MSWLIIKSEILLETATNLFSNSKANIATEGKRRLGSAVGSKTFKKKMLTKKLTKGVKKAAYAAFFFGEQNKYSYFLRIISVMSELMELVHEIIQHDLVPSIIGESITKNERQLYSLPARSEGLGISSFSEKAENDFDNSVYITASLVALKVTQEEILSNDEIVSERVTFIPTQEHSFALTKSEFRDALQILYNKQLEGMPRKCPLGERYDLNHVMNCKRGGFVVMTHNNVRDFEANIMKTIQMTLKPNLVYKH